MKTKLANSIMARLAVACALVTVAADTAAGQGAHGGRLQGTWDTQASIIDCQTGNVITTFQSLIVFMAGGTLTESTSGTAPALRTPGEGVWRHTTDNNYAFRFKHFRFNAQNVLTGWNIIEAEASLDAAGNAYTSSATVEVYDPNGVLIATACATTVGTIRALIDSGIWCLPSAPNRLLMSATAAIKPWASGVSTQRITLPASS